MSLDFRVIPVGDYLNYIRRDEGPTVSYAKPNVSDHRPITYIHGDYYQLMRAASQYRPSNGTVYRTINTSEFVLQMRPHFDHYEATAADAYLRWDNFVTEYKKTSELEAVITDYTQAQDAITTTSGEFSMYPDADTSA